MLSRLLLRHRFPLAGAFLALCGVAIILAVMSLSDASAGPPTAADAPADPSPASAPFPEPEPLPEPEPEPEPEPFPVRGLLTSVEVVDLSVSDTGVFQPGSERDRSLAADDDAIDDFVTAAATWLDDAITDDNLGNGPDDAASGGDGRTSALAWAAPGAPVEKARYTVHVGARGGPEWAEVAVAATRTDGSVRHAVVVFAPADGAVVVLAAEPGGVEPGSGEPGSGDPGSGEPGSGELGSTEAEASGEDDDGVRGTA